MLIISMFYGNIYAQYSIYVEEINGTISEIPLSQVQKIDFSGNDMILHKTDASTIIWATSDVQKYYYDLTINVENPKKSENNDVLIYPNPSNGDFYINYKVQKKGNVSIYLVSIDGKTIINLLSENKEQGEYSLQLNFNLEAGSYFIKIETNNNLITKPIIILNQ